MLLCNSFAEAGVCPEKLLYLCQLWKHCIYIWGHSNVFADIEMVSLFTIRCSIDIKKNYFVSYWSTNAVSLKVQACIFDCTEITKKQQNKIHTQLQWTKELSVHLKVNTMQKLAVVLWKNISIIGCDPVSQLSDFVCLLRWSRARFTRPKHALFEINQRYELIYW